MRVKGQATEQGLGIILEKKKNSSKKGTTRPVVEVTLEKKDSKDETSIDLQRQREPPGGKQ